MSAQTQFFTRQASNEGIRIPLFLPDGSKTEEWIHVLGVDSDRFRQKEAEYRRKAFELSNKKDIEEMERFRDDGKIALLASLVTSWSFPEPCEPDTVFKFLKEAPYLADQIDLLASKRALFIKPPLTSS